MKTGPVPIYRICANCPGATSRYPASAAAVVVEFGHLELLAQFAHACLPSGECIIGVISIIIETST